MNFQIGKGKLLQGAQQRFVEIAYCCYRQGLHSGFEQGQALAAGEKERPLSFQCFCAEIKKIHLEGKSLQGVEGVNGRNFKTAVAQKNP